MLSFNPQRAWPSEDGAEQAFGADPCAALGRAKRPQRDLAHLERGTSLAQVISSDVSDASAIPHKTDDLAAGRTHISWANKVEGLVDFTVRGGSSPLGRISR